MIRHFICLAAVTVLVVAPVLAQPQYETTRIAEGVYQFRYQSHNGFFVVTSDGVVAFDPISVEAAALYASEIKRVAPGLPLRALVYSHDHADHATGAPVLRAAFDGWAPIVAQDNAAVKLADGSPNLPPPDVTFDERLTLHFGGRAIELYYLGKSHSDNMLVAVVPDVRVAFAVDFVSNDRVGYQDLPDYYFPDFFHALERLQTLDFGTIVFGHGAPGDRATVRRQGQYYGALRAAVQHALDRGLSEDEAAQQVRLPAYASWGQYEAWFPMNVRAIYRWLRTN